MNIVRSATLRMLVGALAAVEALAAPDEAALGKDEGYPICPPALQVRTKCLVGEVSRRDEIYPARKVEKGEVTRPLKRAGSEPAIAYTYQSRSGGLDDYLARNRTTGLLILKGDTVLAERYQYDRTPAQRLTSYSMAKTVVAMLVGIALDERKIRSLDDHAGRYVEALDGTPYGETPIRHLLTMSSGVREHYRPGSMPAFNGGFSLFGYGYQTWLIPGRERQFALRGVRQQAMFVEPKSRLVMVHTAAGDMSGASGELLALWFGVVKGLGE